MAVGVSRVSRVGRVGAGCGARCAVYRPGLWAALTLLVLMGVAGLPGSLPAARAAGDTPLADPTRPPPEMMAFLPASAGAAVLAVPRLQSVLIGASVRSAIIDGQRYKVGDRIGDARLLRISENEVVLAGAGGRQTMTLFTPVKQTPAPERTAAPARRAAVRNP